MEYRPFGKLGWDVSPLGFGAMRLPVLEEGSNNIDEELATRMVREGIDAGINYIDTAYPYHGGNNEECVGRILKDGYRDKVKLATKLPLWFVETHDDFSRFLDIQLKKLQTDSVDLYLLHALNAEYWEKTKQLKLLDAAEKAKNEGLIKHIGFSFHDSYSVFEEILDGYDNWEFCQIQYNFMDIDFQAGRKGLHAAARRGLPVVVMEPLKGGLIAAPPPNAVKPLWEKLGADFSTDRNDHVDLALQWLWDQPEVTVVLSGMSTPRQLQQNLESAVRSSGFHFTDAENRIFEELQTRYSSLRKVDCTACRYCMPCPNGVNIPRTLQLYNELFMYGDDSQPRRVYNVVYTPSERADNCIECGECEEKCPQHIPIMESLKKAHALLR